MPGNRPPRRGGRGCGGLVLSYGVAHGLGALGTRPALQKDTVADPHIPTRGGREVSICSQEPGEPAPPGSCVCLRSEVCPL